MAYNKLEMYMIQESAKLILNIHKLLKKPRLLRVKASLHVFNCFYELGFEHSV